VALRLEGRSFQSQDRIFTNFSNTSLPIHCNHFIIGSLACKF
jgi:hypothetical protein